MRCGSLLCRRAIVPYTCKCSGRHSKNCLSPSHMSAFTISSYVFFVRTFPFVFRLLNFSLSTCRKTRAILVLSGTHRRRGSRMHRRLRILVQLEILELSICRLIAEIRSCWLQRSRRVTRIRCTLGRYVRCFWMA